MALDCEMDGRVVVLTGAASGLGRASALGFARAHARQVIVDRNLEELEETARQVRELGGEVVVHGADLADPDACRAPVDEAVTRFGQLDALCNVAGIVHFTHTPEMERSAWDRVIAVNLTAPFLLSQAAIPHLLDSHGAIVNCVSTAAFIGEAYLAAYCASKAGLMQMTKAMAMEYQRKPIRINAVAPGGMMTNISTGMAFPEGLEMDLVARFSGFRGTVPVEDVADMVCLLASPGGRSFHGTCVTVDAGIAAG